MKRSYQASSFNTGNQQALIHQIAYHEAGHVAAIYLGNKKKNLPPVHFQITFNRTFFTSTENLFETRSINNNQIVAAVEGGRLIQNLPITLIESASYFSEKVNDAYQVAFDADMMNLLAGPLAEAKYTSIRDNEQFKRNLINADSLRYYGGASDLEKVQDYLDNLVSCKERQLEKKNSLFHQAFDFIEDAKNWKAIEDIANYLMSVQKSAISCEEIIAAIER